MTRKIYFRTAAALFALAAGCSAIGGDPKENEVRAGVALVRRTLDDTKRSPAAGMAFASTAEQGGSVLSYIAASLPDGAKFTCYLEGGEKKPYCVSIRPGAAPGEYVIEGYGAAVDKPIVVETAVVGMPKRP